MHRRHDFVWFILWATVTTAFPVQPAGAADEAPGAVRQSATPVPDLSGLWTKPYLGWEMPLTGPAPVTNKNRRRQIFDIDGRPWPQATAPLVNSAAKLLGDYSNPILKPAASRAGQATRRERAAGHAQCKRAQPMLAGRRAGDLSRHDVGDAAGERQDHPAL